MAIPMVVGLVHVGLVAPHYYVGSFDDDASYVLSAHALLAGHGLNARLTSGVVMSGLYPPGYSALLVPLVWLWPHTFVPLRLFSVVCYAALFPLTWIYLGRRRWGDMRRAAVLIILALAPPLATFASMVMAETPYLVLLMVVLLLLDRWESGSRDASWTGVGVVVGAAGLIWLKQAGIGLVAGMVLWFVLRRLWTRAAMLVVGAGVLVLPVLVARLQAGVALAGSRYSQELGGYYQGGLLHRLADVLPHSTWHLLSTAIPATLVPYLDPLPVSGHWSDFWIGLSWQVTILAAAGVVVWFRRYRDAAVVVAGVYLAETVLWPQVNERRAILVLPLLAAWYVLGAATTWEWLEGRVRSSGLGGRGAPPSGGIRLLGLRVVAGVFVLGAVVGPLVAQAPRDYLFGWNQSSSHFEGARYVELLSRLGQADDVIETDYLSSTALFTGHRTNDNAFLATLGLCYEPGVIQALAADDASFLLLGDVNKPHLMDSPCLLVEAQQSPWAVPLLHSDRDDAYVFELIGPGTGHPQLTNLLAARSPTLHGTTLEYDWTTPQTLSQLSVGQAGLVGSATSSVRLELRRPDGSWLVEAQARSVVGDGGTSFLLAALGSGVPATGVRVVVSGPPGGELAVSDLAAVGPSASTRS